MRGLVATVWVALARILSCTSSAVPTTWSLPPRSVLPPTDSASVVFVRYVYTPKSVHLELHRPPGSTQVNPVPLAVSTWPLVGVLETARCDSSTEPSISSEESTELGANFDASMES